MTKPHLLTPYCYKFSRFFEGTSSTFDINTANNTQYNEKKNIRSNFLSLLLLLTLLRNNKTAEILYVIKNSKNNIKILYNTSNDSFS